MKADLRTALQSQLLIGDGAMGTFLYQLGLPVGISYEELNLTKPHTIAEVHRRYYEAGARFIETNTFSANREKLSKYGLEHKVKSINQAGVSIARQAVGEDAYVVGSVGSIRDSKHNHLAMEVIEFALREQIQSLLEAEVDGIILETFFDLEQLLLALRIVRELSNTTVICQFATEGIGMSSEAISLHDAFIKLKQAGADVVGLNCRVGPNGILRTMETLHVQDIVPLSIFPNAGLPDYEDGTFSYTASPEYFAESAMEFVRLGARIIGGCCGTTPEHISAVAKILKNVQVPELILSSQSDTNSLSFNQRQLTNDEVMHTDTRSSQLQKPTIIDLVKQRATVIVELDPPRDLDIDKFMQGAQALHDAHVDAITMADNSLAVTRMSNLALGYVLKDKLQATPLVHIACRDRNLIGTQSHLMGLHALGIDHVLAVTGDPAKFGDLPGSSSVYDLTSFEMIRMIKQLNAGIAFSGKPLKKKANFIVGAAFNPNVKYLDKAIQRLERKVEAGADYIMTQPIYDPALIEVIHKLTRHLHIPIFIGVMPLASGRNAEYLHNEVPGIQLSDDVRLKMKGLDGQAGREMGLAIAKQMIDTILPFFNGIYIMTPFLLYEMSVQLTNYVWGKTK
jgi:methionine synthase I (cobalamin-dependent)/5,10-methylenetetrahydrofolate reductase